MKLEVEFYCLVDVRISKKHYTGVIQLNPPGRSPKTFYFNFLNPYGGKESEISFYHDLAMTHLFAEMIGREVFHEGMPTEVYGKETLQLDPASPDRPVTAYELYPFEDEKVGITFVVVNIISEAIRRTDSEWEDKQVLSNQRISPRSEFRHVWKKEFGVTTEKYAKQFIEGFWE